MRLLVALLFLAACAHAPAPTPAPAPAPDCSLPVQDCLQQCPAPSHAYVVLDPVQHLYRCFCMEPPT